jgi:phage host-nuclease inhibitor protein Gam
MKVSELANTVTGLSDTVGGLANKVTDLKTEMDGKFAAVDGEFKTLRALIKSEGETLRRDLEETLSQRITSEGEALRRDLDETLSQWIRSEGETTRRHFDVVAEKMVSERNLALDRSMATAQQLLGLTASNAGDHVRFERRLDDHDRRLEIDREGSRRGFPAMRSA